MRNNATLRVIYGVVFGSLTVGFIVAVGHILPYSAARVWFTDMASLPAFLITRVFYPEGVHTGGGIPQWGIVFLISNIMVYSVAWWFILTILFRWKRDPGGINISPPRT